MYNATPEDRFRSELVRARKAAGLSQTALADRLGWSQMKISRIESGTSQRLNEVIRLCELLGGNLADTFATPGSGGDPATAYRRGYSDALETAGKLINDHKEKIND